MQDRAGCTVLHMSSSVLTTGTPAQILKALVGSSPSVADLRSELDDVEGMSDRTAVDLFGSLERKAAYERLVFRRFYAANTARS